LHSLLNTISFTSQKQNENIYFNSWLMAQLMELAQSNPILEKQGHRAVPIDLPGMEEIKLQFTK
jgi:hypothetical protein